MTTDLSRSTEAYHWARRSELHDIVHSLNRSTPGPEPARQGYPQYPPSIKGFGMSPNVFPMLAYPAGPPMSGSAPSLNMARALTYTSPTPGILPTTAGMPEAGFLKIDLELGTT